MIEKCADPEFDWVVEISSGRGLRERAENVLVEASRRSGGGTQLWVQDVGVGDDQRLEDIGFRPYRDLWQLRVLLPAKMPAGYDPVEVRAYETADEEEFLRVNSRAFAWHPEQGRLTSEGLLERMAEPWYDREGFLILELDGGMAGFCWTKVHDEPPAGEIYAIAVDPDFAGRGLGMPLTHAGLEYLHHQRGMNSGMLYVESDNAPANRIYQKLGFRLGQVNRAYRAEIAG